jgi:HNH endonuclease
MRHSLEFIGRRLGSRSVVNVERAAVNGVHCREWQRASHNQGYGRLWDGERLQYTHRLAYEVATAEAPGVLDVLHECDNPRCIEPAHLKVGTAADNTADMIARGRHRAGRAAASIRLQGRPSKARGSKHVLAKLDERQVLSIKARLKRPYFVANRPTALAAEFGVSCSTIRAIAVGTAWGWLK